VDVPGVDGDVVAAVGHPAVPSGVLMAEADVVHVVLSEIAWPFDAELAERNAGVIRDATPTVEDACRGLEHMARLLNEAPRFARRYLNDRVASTSD
jgi:hypothetical protein